jgi:hypothetical protein
MPPLETLVVGVVAGRDVGEETGVASAPRVDGLFQVADLEERAGSRFVLHDLVDQVRDDAPLQQVRVLEFIEEPMVVTGVKPVVDAEALVRPGDLGEDRRLAPFLSALSGEEELRVLEGEPPAPPHLLGVDRLVMLQKIPNAPGALQFHGEFAADDPLEDRPERIADGTVEELHRPVELHPGRSGDDVAPDRQDPLGHILDRVHERHAGTVS